MDSRYLLSELLGGREKSHRDYVTMGDGLFEVMMAKIGKIEMEVGVLL